MPHNYYKVVLNKNGQLYSALHNLLPDAAVVEYSLQNFTQAPFGGLLVFNNRESARNFKKRESCGSLEIYQCAVQEPVELLGWNILYASTDDWNPRFYSSRSPSWPLGTCAFKKVKLLRKVR